MVNIPGILRAKRRVPIEEVRFLPITQVFKPQRHVVMLKDVTGWVNNDKRTARKWHFSAGKEYFIDTDVADQFIVKGYAKGELSRHFSDDELAEIRASVVNISHIGGATHG